MNLDLLNLNKKKYRQGISWLIIACAFALTALAEFVAQPKINRVSVWLAVLGTAVYMSCAYVLYFVEWYNGEQSGQDSEEYTNCIKTHTDRVNDIRDRIPQISAFCKEYVETEFHEARKNILDLVGIQYSEYLEKYEGRKLPKDMPRYMRKAIRKADRVKPIKVNKDTLLSKTNLNSDRHRSMSPIYKKARITATTLGRMSVCTALCAQVGFEVLFNTNNILASLVSAIMKTMMLLVWCFSTKHKAYNYITKDVTEYIDFQNEVLEQFKNWQPKEGGLIESRDKDE